MKPASYQSVASSVMSPNMTLGHLLSTPNVMRCEKCRFATTDIADFKKHMAREHIEYYCFYCNSVSLSEAELQAHLKIHTASSPFKCPHCGQVYMRRMCLIKHIERFHSINIPQAPKIESTKNSHVSVSSASQSASSVSDSLSQRPTVRVTVPTPNVTGVRLDSNFQRLKSLNSCLSNVSHGEAVPLNGQRNRALTVSLPEEVSIPAGCMVEVAEVKTVDGTKELRLRFVAHQEKESVIKNVRNTVPETSKVLSSHMKFQNTASESEMRIVNNTNRETNIVNKEHPSLVSVNVSKGLPNPSMMVNKEHPTLVPANISKGLPNPLLKEQCRSTKRSSPEVINLDADVPSKISRSFISIGDSAVATHIDSINHNVAPAAIPSMFARRIISGSVQPETQSARVCPRRVEERRTIQACPSSLASIMTNKVQSTPRIVPVNRGPVTMKANECSLQKNKQESTKPQQQCSKTQFLPLVPSAVASTQIRVSDECKDNFVPKTIFPQDSSQKITTEPLPANKPTKTSNTHLKLSPLSQEVKVENTATGSVRVEREGFPVISSVYSLSRQPDDPRESSQPIVMAEWTNSAGRDSLNIKSVRSEQLKVTLGHHAHTESKDGKLSQNILPNKILCDSVKIEKDQCIQLCGPGSNSVHFKKEKSTSAKDKKTCKSAGKTCSLFKKPVHSSPFIPKPMLSENASIKKVVATKDKVENPSKFLTVSLKRVQVGIWKKNKKKQKSLVFKSRSPDLFDGIRSCTVLQLMPLRKNQAVKRSSPNQPVVVLNHPKPNVHLERRITSICTNKGSSVAPKCQIKKMKLRKVTGETYEVMECTVQNFD